MKAATGKARSCPVLLLRLFLTRAPQVPGLAVVLVGERKARPRTLASFVLPAPSSLWSLPPFPHQRTPLPSQDSETYVRNKKKACAECGIASFGADLPATATEAEVLAAITLFNADPAVHGVLVQLPLPSHISEERVLAAISLEKDVDGFHPLNVGRLHMRGRAPLFVPCTPKGVIELLVRSGVAVAGARAVVVGRSNIVGAPAAALLQRLDATVTVVHSRTERPEEVVRQADIVVAAMGVPGFVRGAWLKPGCAVIDVGINAVPDASRKTGYRLVGDVAYDEAVLVAGLITPVPGGVGPMTIACLLANTLEGAQRALGWTG